MEGGAPCRTCGAVPGSLRRCRGGISIGISSGDLGEALVVLGEATKGLSPGALGRLKAQRSEEYRGWTRRDLADKQYPY